MTGRREDGGVMTISVAGRCKSCRHWDFNPNAPYNPNDTGGCKRTAHNGSYPEDETTLAWCFSMDESDCKLSTHEDFGCVQWEPKEPE